MSSKFHLAFMKTDNASINTDKSAQHALLASVLCISVSAECGVNILHKNQITWHSYDIVRDDYSSTVIQYCNVDI